MFKDDWIKKYVFILHFKTVQKDVLVFYLLSLYLLQSVC